MEAVRRSGSASSYGREPWSHHVPRLLLPCAVAAVLGCSATSAPPAEQPAFSTGQAQRLSVRVESEVSGGLPSGASNKRYSLRGTAALQPLSNGDHDAPIRLQLEDLALQASSADEQPALTALLPVLGEPAVFTLRGGSVHDLRVSPRMQMQAYGWLRAVISALQWPERVDAGGVEVEEEDATGRYHARVERAATGLRKVKTRYVNLSARGIGSKSLGLTPEVVRSEHARSPASGPPLRITVDETIRMPLSEGNMLEVTTRVQLSALRREPSPALTAKELQAAERALARLAAFSPPTPREGAFDAERIGRATLDEVLAEIERLEPAAGATAGAGGGDATSAYLERFSLIAAMLRQRPGDVERAGELIRSGHARSSMLLQALASAGTDQPQTLLRGFAAGEGGVSAQVRSLAATSLLRVKQPAEPTVELLMRWANEAAMEEHGLYGLGTAARHLRGRGQSQRAQAIAELLGDALRKAKEPARVERVLRGIANSADASLFEPVRARAADPSAGIRTAAIDALRFMEHPGVDALLLERARVEQDTAALRALSSTLSARKPSAELAQAVTELAAGRQRYGVRFAAVEQAGKWRKARPELRALLARVSRSDEREEVRVLALGLLKPAGEDKR
jgi:hypothetical protein